MLLGYGLVRFLDLIELSDHGSIDRDGILSYVYAHIFTDLDLLVPWVGPDPFDIQSVCRLGAKDLPYQVLTGVGDELWNLIFSIENLLIELIGLGVFER